MAVLCPHRKEPFMNVRVPFPILLCVLVLVLAATPLVAQIPNEQTPIFIGQWGPVFSWPVVAIHASVMPDGRVLTWDRNDPVLTTATWLWNPANGAFTSYMNSRASIFCSGHTFLRNGTLLVAGGHVFKDYIGSNALTFFDGGGAPRWATGPNMGPAATHGRWYPSAVMLRNGDVLVAGGSNQGEFDMNVIPQVWQSATNTWRNLTSASRSVPLYPMLFLAPDGRVFMAGPFARSAFLNTAGTGSWTNGPASSVYRDYGSAVEYEPGKILIAGGGSPVATAETIDLNRPNPQWVAAPSMNYKRRQHNATILPDGRVLVTGGTSGPGFNDVAGSVLASEVWSPGSTSWQVVKAQAERRLYHSTAVLLHDGSVLSIGGGKLIQTGGVVDSDHYTAQVYKPNYFFKGPRPTITGAPNSVTFNQTFAVQTPNAANISSVTLVRLSSATHSLNMSQRFHRLPVTVGTGQVTVTAPTNASCAPGPYLMHVLNTTSVPSVGRLVYIQ